MDKIAPKPARILEIFAVLYTVYFMQALLFPICLSMIFYFLLGPAIRFLESRRVPKAIGAALVVISLVSASSFCMTALVEPATTWLDKAPKHLRVIEKRLQFIKNPIEKISAAGKKVEEMTSVSSSSHGDDQNRKIDIEVGSSSFGYALFDVTSNAFSTVAAVLILLYFFLVYGDEVLKRCGELLSISGEQDTPILSKIEKGISSYLVTFTSINLCLALVVGVSLWLLSVPNAALWGAMAGILNFVPYLGPLLGVGVVSFVSLLSFDATWAIILPPAVYFAINSIEGQLITPILLGNRLSLNPLIILLGMMTCGWAWGMAGALLSVPLLAIFKIVCDEIPSLNGLGRVLEA